MKAQKKILTCLFLNVNVLHIFTSDFIYHLSSCFDPAEGIMKCFSPICFSSGILRNVSAVTHVWWKSKVLVSDVFIITLMEGWVQSKMFTFVNFCCGRAVALCVPTPPWLTIYHQHLRTQHRWRCCHDSLCLNRPETKV